MSESPWVIKVENLSKYYGRVCAIRNISFEVPQGLVTGFVGPNGAGKSTTMRCILGLTRPSEGTVSVLGTEYKKLSNPALRVGTVLDASKQNPGRTGRSVLLAATDILGIASSKIDFALESCGLTKSESRRRIGTYSLGMRQRLALALAILPEPELLILDEPVNGLDPEGIYWMRSFFRNFTQAGGTVF
ncbi:ATP-binding cassette domain-containing protein [Arcanobacterium hippocoleae]|uniref:ATP-binding cassette domain-containing protein n=1 Tax=Arcanobacterium hippocoleae TaxID=149017 RepID=UPI00333FA66A